MTTSHPSDGSAKTNSIRCGYLCRCIVHSFVSFVGESSRECVQRLTQHNSTDVSAEPPRWIRWLRQLRRVKAEKHTHTLNYQPRIFMIERKAYYTILISCGECKRARAQLLSCKSNTPNAINAVRIFVNAVAPLTTTTSIVQVHTHVHTCSMILISRAWSTLRRVARFVLTSECRTSHWGGVHTTRLHSARTAQRPTCTQ